jgi:hypothetical protein
MVCESHLKVLGKSLEPLGTPWKVLGKSLEPLGKSLETPWKVFKTPRLTKKLGAAHQVRYASTTPVSSTTEAVSIGQTDGACRDTTYIGMHRKHKHSNRNTNRQHKHE